MSPVHVLRNRLARADHQLGGVAERGPEYQHRRALSVADATGGAGDPDDPGLQSFWRRAQGRRRSL